MYSSNSFNFEAVIALPFLLVYWFIHLIKSCISPIAYDNFNTARLEGKIAIITGSNTGVGRETAAQLFDMGATVILACRDVEKGKQAREYILRQREIVGDKDVMIMCLDLGSFRSILSFVIEYKKKFNSLDILVNNAGLNIEGTTEDGLQQLFQVNYLGHYLLVRLLFGLYSYDKLISADSKVLIDKKSSHLFTSDDIRILQSKLLVSNARIVNLSSVMHHAGACDFEASSLPRNIALSTMKGKSYYNDSKLYMNLLTYEINKRFSVLGSLIYNNDNNSEQLFNISRGSLLAISANPGAVRSDIWRHVPRFVMPIFDFVMKSLFLTVEQGASTSVYGVVIPTDDVDTRCHHASEVFTRQHHDSPHSHTAMNPLIPYVAPYSQPISRIGIGMEMLGPYTGPSFVPCTSPGNIRKQSNTLWNMSAALCSKALRKHGVTAEYIKLDETL